MSYLGPYKFYSESIILWFDPEKHVYYKQNKLDMTPVEGVTNIIHILDKSDALIPWACLMVYERAMSTIPYDQDTLLDFSGPQTKPLTTLEIDRWLSAAKKAPREIKESAGDTGTLAHNCLEDSIKEARRIRLADEEAVIVKQIINWPADERAINCVKAAFSWMNIHNVRWLETERKVYSKQYSFAGTLDGVALVDSCDDKKCKGCKDEKFKNVLSLIDWKSSNGLWVDYLYQTAAYQYAYEEEFDTQIVDRWILRLGKEDGEFDPWRISPVDFEQDFKAFTYCLELSRIHKAVKNRMKVFTKYRNSKS